MRKVSYGVGVERIFPVESPSVEKVEIKSRGHVRRSRLYYLRELRGKKARLRSKVRDVSGLISEEEAEGESGTAAAASEAAEAKGEELEVAAPDEEEEATTPEAEAAPSEEPKES